MWLKALGLQFRSQLVELRLREIGLYGGLSYSVDGGCASSQASSPKNAEDAEDICEDVTFEWGPGNRTINPCNLTWSCFPPCPVPSSLFTLTFSHNLCSSTLLRPLFLMQHTRCANSRPFPLINSHAHLRGPPCSAIDMYFCGVS